MDEQPNASKQIVDHRATATHGLAGVLGVLVGLLFGHATGTTQDPDRDLVLITSTALDRGDDFWAAHLEPSVWRMPHLVLVDHEHGERTPCGRADATTGPFYCPANERIYLDVDFLHAIPGELARAYVTAHELGHHVQKLRGELSGRASIAIELGADCYAGAWMRSEQALGHLAPGDVAAALTEAAAVGDDRLCPSCSMESWTHGSAAQRTQALTDGLNGGVCSEWRSR